MAHTEAHGYAHGVEVHTINYHIKKIFSDSELQEASVIRNFRITAHDGLYISYFIGQQYCETLLP